jgi:acid phosphatase (class A)
VLPQPAAEKSAFSRAEGDLVLAIQADASDAAKERMKAEENVTVWAFSEVLGPEFKQASYPRTARLLAMVDNDTYLVSVAAKDHFNRPRPPAQDERVKPLVTPSTTAGYPSGHAVRGMIWARLLGDLAPKHADALRARARLIALDRVIAGMHYPTDAAAGIALGDAIVDALMTNEKFKKELDGVRAAEWHQP